ncbi:hypothetical protein GBAR_LOCUS28991 [Geodia barretti]|uniref:Uncharacterized protein n=1 Tax=Geodia barretti TaxID=519541 RepID=A0AA35XBV7_GEOBA|nr:hypothetical protein GBAR_LOCUS28991 [Geodia barretti]
MHTAVEDYGVAEYGYIEGEVGMGDEVVVIVRRSQTHPHQPAHDIKEFSTGDLSSDASKVYLYNAVWNNNTNLPVFTRVLNAFLLVSGMAAISQSLLDEDKLRVAMTGGVLEERD